MTQEIHPPLARHLILSLSRAPFHRDAPIARRGGATPRARESETRAFTRSSSRHARAPPRTIRRVDALERDGARVRARRRARRARASAGRSRCTTRGIGGASRAFPGRGTTRRARWRGAMRSRTTGRMGTGTGMGREKRGEDAAAKAKTRAVTGRGEVDGGKGAR